MSRRFFHPNLSEIALLALLNPYIDLPGIIVQQKIIFGRILIDQIRHFPLIFSEILAVDGLAAACIHIRFFVHNGAD